MPGAEPADPGAPRPVRPPRAAVAAVARDVSVGLQLPSADPMIGPDPSVNEWKMAVVGFPVWVWTNGERDLSASNTAYGLTFTLHARQIDTVFDMGDGHRMVCARTAPYPVAVKPGTPSPVCGYAYQKASLPRGVYTVTATTRWEVDWAAGGYSGTLPVTRTASRQLPVGELQTVVVG